MLDKVRTLMRSARSGRFVSGDEVEKHPGTTVVEKRDDQELADLRWKIDNLRTALIQAADKIRVSDPELASELRTIAKANSWS